VHATKSQEHDKE